MLSMMLLKVKLDYRSELSGQPEEFKWQKKKKKHTYKKNSESHY